MLSPSPCLYRHKLNRDVAMGIRTWINRDDGSMDLCVSWWNIGACHEPYPIGLAPQWIKLKSLADWVRMDFDERLDPAPHKEF
jgi:hypothetical protein